MTAVDDLPPVLTTREAMNLLRCGRRQLYDAIESGEVEGVKVASRWKIPRDPLLRKLGLLDNEQADVADGNVVQLRREASS